MDVPNVWKAEYPLMNIDDKYVSFWTTTKIRADCNIPASLPSSSRELQRNTADRKLLLLTEVLAAQ